MTDAAKCAAHDCPQSAMCWRYRMVVRDPARQAWVDPRDQGGIRCMLYEPIRDGDELEPIKEDE